MTLGIDEVGRGALAGPVVVGAAAFPDGEQEAILLELEKVLRRTLTDSKKLTRLQRERAFRYLENTVIWACGEASPQEIDSLGLTAAISLAASRAISALPELPTAILADAGLRHPFEIPTEHIIKGDEKIPEISVASIMAKVCRDSLMYKLAENYEDYGWDNNVGYGTAHHMQAVRKLGMTPLHRRLFCKGLQEGI